MSVYKNTLWSLLSILGVQLINILTNVILARLLVPEFFGTLGMAMVFAGAVFVIQDVGLNSYLIYKKEENKGEFNNLISLTFLFNILIAAFFVVILVFSSPYIADFYNNTGVETILKFISLGLLIGAFGSTQRAILMKNNQFSKITVIDITAEILSSICTIGLAIFSNGLFAIAAKYVIRPTIQTILVSRYVRIPIIHKFKKQELKNMISYNSNVLGAQLLIYFNNNVDFLIIGKSLGDKLLGIYTLAFQWGALARYYIAGAVMRALFPEVSKKQGDKIELKRIYLDIVSKLSFICLPICLGLATVSYEFIYIVYGSKWIDVASILQIMLIAGGMASISVIGGPILRGIGRPDLEMKITLCSFTIYSLLVLVGVRYGLLAVAFAELLRVCIIESIRTVIVTKHLNIRINEIYKHLIPSVKCVIIMVIAVLLSDFISGYVNIYIVFIIKILIGLTVYLLCSYKLNKDASNWIITIASKKMIKFSKREAH